MQLIYSARTWIVFFDPNSVTLSERGQVTAAEAVAVHNHVAISQIILSGHTDTTGTESYNQRLSERRAEAVATELVRLGVPRSIIVTRGYGSSRLLVPTDVNVSEPQNRRVDFIFR